MISQQIYSTSQTILNTINYAMLLGKQNEITKMLSAIKTAPSIISISITDLKGNVFKSTNSNIKKIDLSNVPVKSGNLNILLKTNKNDEIGMLINGYNQMINNLNNLYKEIENLHQKEIQKAGQIAF